MCSNRDGRLWLGLVYSSRIQFSTTATRVCCFTWHKTHSAGKQPTITAEGDNSARTMHAILPSGVAAAPLLLPHSSCFCLAWLSHSVPTPCTLLPLQVCKTAPVPGETKVWQYITLMKRIFLIDCPGVVYHGTNDSESGAVLKGVVRVEGLEDATQYVQAVLERVKPEYLVSGRALCALMFCVLSTRCVVSNMVSCCMAMHVVVCFVCVLCVAAAWLLVWLHDCMCAGWGAATC
jgi:hypothetical protein